VPMTLKAKLAEPGRLLTCVISVIPSAVVTQAIAAAGADCVIIDQEHGPIGFETLHAMVAATQGTSCAPLVRVPEMGDAHVKRALDAGAEGICFPLIRTAADAERSRRQHALCTVGEPRVGAVRGALALGNAVVRLCRRSGPGNGVHAAD
jgi:2-keto-3-deoxy-L-rhamnonate aldolase RhmA